MDALVITAGELEAMTGLSTQARCLYLFFRSRMDLASRLAGKVTRLSEKSCQEALEEYRPKGKGFQIIKFTLEQIRTAIAALVRAGLVVRTSAPMVFLLAKARGVFARPAQTPCKQPTSENATTTVTTRPASHTPTIAPRQTPHTSVVCVTAKSIATQPASAHAISAKAAAAFGWMQQTAGGYKIAKPTGANVAKFESLFIAGQSAVATATATAKARRETEGSDAPIQPGLVLACLPKHVSTTTSTILVPPTKRPDQRPEIPPLVIDAAAVARGNTLLARFAKRNHSEVRA